jgi:hypothetical protein
MSIFLVRFCYLVLLSHTLLEVWLTTITQVAHKISLIHFLFPAVVSTVGSCAALYAFREDRCGCASLLMEGQGVVCLLRGIVTLVVGEVLSGLIWCIKW